MREATSVKSERISLRLDSATKHRIEQAAELSHRSISSFILSSALGSADEVIHDSETLQLADEDKAQFFDAIFDPPEPHDALREAFQVHDRLTRKSQKSTADSHQNG